VSGVGGGGGGAPPLPPFTAAGCEYRGRWRGGTGALASPVCGCESRLQQLVFFSFPPIPAIVPINPLGSSTTFPPRPPAADCVGLCIFRRAATVPSTAAAAARVVRWCRRARRQSLLSSLPLPGPLCCPCGALQARRAPCPRVCQTGRRPLRGARGSRPRRHPPPPPSWPSAAAAARARPPARRAPATHRPPGAAPLTRPAAPPPRRRPPPPAPPPRRQPNPPRPRTQPTA